MNQDKTFINILNFVSFQDGLRKRLTSNSSAKEKEALASAVTSTSPKAKKDEGAGRKGDQI